MSSTVFGEKQPVHALKQNNYPPGPSCSPSRLGQTSIILRLNHPSAPGSLASNGWWLPQVLMEKIFYDGTVCPRRPKLSLGSGRCRNYSLKGRTARSWDAIFSCLPGEGNPWLELNRETLLKERYLGGFSSFAAPSKQKLKLL